MLQPFVRRKYPTSQRTRSNKNIDTFIYEVITAKDYLNIKEAALLLGVSGRTFYRLMKDGTIKSHKLGGLYSRQIRSCKSIISSNERYALWRRHL